jgi:uncharacterized protein YqjF (DUF2071 family)
VCQAKHLMAAIPEPISTISPALAGRSSSSQRWSELMFVHWRVDSALVAPLLPPGTTPDEFDGSSWVGLIPFVLDRARIFGSPPIPYFGTFVEINVRLYAVDSEGRRGVVFVSLEASRLAAVLAARTIFSIPYVWAATTLVRHEGTYTYSSRRHTGGHETSRIVGRASTRVVTGDALADFLTARWALFTLHRGKTILLPNEHEPWPLYEATLLELDDQLLAAAGFPGLAARAPDSVLYSPGVTTRFGSAASVVLNEQTRHRAS